MGPVGTDGLDLAQDARTLTGDAAKITGEIELESATDVAAELVLIDVPLEFESLGVWAGD